MKQQKRWTVQEIAKFQQIYPDKSRTIKEIADLFQCTDIGIRGMAQRLDITRAKSHNRKRVSSKWYENWNNVEEAIKSEYGHLLSSGICPTYDQLAIMGLSMTIMGPIHGGMQGIADKLKCKLASHWKCRDGHWVQSINELAVDEYMYSRDIKHTPQTYAGRYRADFSIHGYLVEVWGYSGDENTKISSQYVAKKAKKEAYYASNGFNLIGIDRSVHLDARIIKIKLIEKNLDDVFSAAGFCVIPIRPFDISIFTRAAGFNIDEKSIQEEIHLMMLQLRRFPTYAEITNRGLASPVTRHGGMGHFRKIMGQTVVSDGRMLRQKWTDQIITDRLQHVLHLLGRFPSQKELANYDQHLLSGVNKCGGLEKYKEKMGHMTHKRLGYWNLKTVVEEIRNAYGDILPSLGRIRRDKKYDILNAIKRNGGMTAVKSAWTNKS